MKKRKIVIWGMIVLLATGLTAWRLWPRTIDSFIWEPGVEPDQVFSRLTVLGTENGRAVYRDYDLLAKYSYEMTGEASEEARAVMEILRGGRFRASFANLLPWTWGSLRPGNSYDGRRIIMNLL